MGIESVASRLIYRCLIRKPLQIAQDPAVNAYRETGFKVTGERDCFSPEKIPDDLLLIHPQFIMVFS